MTGPVLMSDYWLEGGSASSLPIAHNSWSAAHPSLWREGGGHCQSGQAQELQTISLLAPTVRPVWPVLTPSQSVRPVLTPSESVRPVVTPSQPLRPVLTPSQ